MMELLHALTDRELEALARDLEAGRRSLASPAFTLQSLLGETRAAGVAGALGQLAQRGFTGPQAALLLCTLRDARQRSEADDWIDLVTTAPESGVDVARDTGVVVRDLFQSARQSVLVAGYAVRQGRKIFAALADRMQTRPELDVQLFLDIRRKDGDTTAPSELAQRFGTRFLNEDWPADRPRPPAFYSARTVALTGPHCSLHAKCVVIDRAEVFVSSANFTEAAQERNIEVGLLVRRASLAARLHDFFTSLRTRGEMLPLW